MKQIIIMGATSGIGYETAKIYIRNGWQVGVAGRRKEPLEELKRLSPDRVFTQIIDITSPEAVPGLLLLIEKTGGMDVYLHCFGIGSQNKQLEPETEINTLRTNGEGFTRMITTAFNYFKETGSGHIAVISFHSRNQRNRNRPLLLCHQAIPEYLHGSFGTTRTTAKTEYLFY